MSSPALARFAAGELIPGSDATTDDELAASVRAHGQTIYHPVGTCKMGTDTMSVVDPALRVHGLEHLRVVDASVMPTITRGHTHAPAVMIAEKAAAIILGKDRAAAELAYV
jgi:choline dehydrogenase